MEQFSRLELLLGSKKVELIRGSFVAVVGLGAVGSYALEALARAGIGRLRLVDFDTVRPTNMNRNILALQSTLGKQKVDIAKERLLEINPRCRVDTLAVFADTKTAEEILAGPPDLVIDAIDSVTPKSQLLIACHQKKIPVISSMGAALRKDPSAIKSADLFDTKGCPLAMRMRQRLRRAGVGRGIRCVYSDELVTGGFLRPGVLIEAGDYERGRKRSRLGSLPTVTGIFGLTIAHYAIEKLCKGFAEIPDTSARSIAI